MTRLPPRTSWWRARKKSGSQVFPYFFTQSCLINSSNSFLNISTEVWITSYFLSSAIRRRCSDHSRVKTSLTFTSLQLSEWPETCTLTGVGFASPSAWFSHFWVCHQIRPHWKLIGQGMIAIRDKIQFQLQFSLPSLYPTSPLLPGLVPFSYPSLTNLSSLSRMESNRELIYRSFAIWYL